MSTRKLATIIGSNYLIIFFTAIFANFFVLEGIKADPIGMVQHSGHLIRLGAVAFLFASFSDIVVAWALHHLYKKNILTSLSTLFRVTHAVLMAVGVFSLIEIVSVDTTSEVLLLVTRFNLIWLIGLFFFGFHLMLLAKIAQIPKLISYFLFAAGAMYTIDTAAHFLLPNYSEYADIFLMLVAIPSIFGEMAFGLWMLIAGGKAKSSQA